MADVEVNSLTCSTGDKEDEMWMGCGSVVYFVIGIYKTQNYIIFYCQTDER